MSESRYKPSVVTMKVNAKGIGQFTLNGMDISNHVMKATLYTEACHKTIVTFEMVVDELEVEAETTEEVTPQTQG